MVLGDAFFSIIGESETKPNETFMKQLVGNAEAAIDTVDNLGYIDRNHVAVRGPLYCAFITANLLIYSNLLAVSITHH